MDDKNAESFKGPSVSIATGAKSCEIRIWAYLSVFFDAAFPAALPAEIEERATYEAAKVFVTVTS